ncbi:TetR/AcrR family transcriptional regulator [Nocardia bhagyanarayanae]|uniref:TetR family transcriptional regulator n=1 Tax=Nocardia bhagyanarayanae TaxID=1215925 RepID=A0A543F9W3_9NOCA|nr:TetR/AcrR family transcriptional regulator [Nocardia bhagyanarayanae]TQM30617.1 TetR family transcriptional regulator [Nocardia bhagyanarayanae]
MLGESIRDRKAERREATRREILDAAWTLAREHGLAQLTLRAVATEVGMRAPSLYTHFPSKNAIYDAMYGQAWSECEAISQRVYDGLPASPRPLMRALARNFFDFSVADLPRYQLMNQRTLPGFEPSEQTYAVAERVLRMLLDRLADIGVTDRGDIEIWMALVAGLVDQQLANDPGGDSRRRLLDRAVDMWSDGVGLPEDNEKPRTSRRSR